MKCKELFFFSLIYCFYLPESIIVAPLHAIEDLVEWKVRAFKPYFSPMTGWPGEAPNPVTLKRKYITLEKYASYI